MDSVGVVSAVAEQRGLNPEKILTGFGILRSGKHLGGETRDMSKRFVEIERERRVLPVPPMAFTAMEFHLKFEESANKLVEMEVLSSFICSPHPPRFRVRRC